MIATSAMTAPVNIIHLTGPPPEGLATKANGSPVSARTVAVGIGITEVAVGVGVTVTVTTVVGVLVGVAVTVVGVAVGVEVFGVLVGVGVFVGVPVGVAVGVFGVLVAVGVLVGVAVFVGVAVGVFGVLVAVGVAVLVGVLVGVAVFVGVAVGVEVLVGVGVSVMHSDPDTGVPLQGSGTSVGVLGTFVPIGVGSGRSAYTPLVVEPSMIEPIIMASATTKTSAKDILTILVLTRGTPPRGALAKDNRKAADLKNFLRP